MPKQNARGGMLAGTIIGATVGVVGALLLAPKSGAKLREDISDKLQGFGQKTREWTTAIGSNAKNVLTSVKDEASELASQVNQSNERIKDSISSAKEEMKDRMATRDLP